MAEGVSLTIPQFNKLGKETQEKILNNLESFKGVFSKNVETMLGFRKDNLDIRKKEEAEAKRLLEAQKKLQETITPSIPKTKFQKMQEKLTERYHKWIVKKDFFKQIGGWLKKLVDKAGGWLMDLLKILFFLAIFDPNGKFLNSILNFITDIAVYIVKEITKRLPGLIKTMWNLFWTVLVPGFYEMGKKISEAIFGKDSVLSKIVGVLTGALPILLLLFGTYAKLAPLLGPVMGALIRAFSVIEVDGVKQIGAGRKALTKFKDGMKSLITSLNKGIKNSAKVFKKALSSMAEGISVGAKKTGGFLKGVWGSILKGLKFLGGMILTGLIALKGALVTFFTTVLLPLLPFIAIALAIAAIAYLVYKYWDEIKVGLGILWEHAKAFGAWFWEGIKAIPGAIWGGIVTVSNFIWKWIKKLATKYVKMIVGVFKKVSNVFKSIFEDIIDFVRPIGKVFSTIGGFISDVWDLLKNGVLKGFNAIKESFSGLLDWFEGLMTFGLSWVTMDKKEKENFYDLQKASRESGVDLSLAEKISEAKGEEKKELMKDANQQTIRMADYMKKKGMDVEDLAEKNVTTHIRYVKSTRIHNPKKQNRN